MYTYSNFDSYTNLVQYSLFLPQLKRSFSYFRFKLKKLIARDFYRNCRFYYTIGTYSFTKKV